MYLSSRNIFQNNEDISTLLQLPTFINFDFPKSTKLISNDKSFAILYDDSILIYVDLKTKKIKWYKKFLNNEKISNVQINKDNQITFIKKLSTHNEIITLSNNNMNYNELKLKEHILNYKMFESPDKEDPSDLILIINDLFQMSLYKDNILEKSVNRNIIKDVQDGLIQVNNKIIKIEYLSEQKLILIFFDNGLMAIYTIYKDIIENEYENEDKIEYINCIDLNEDENIKYSYDNISIHTNNYICYNKEQKNEIMEIENNDDEEDDINKENEANKEGILTTLLTLVINKSNFNKRKSSLYFFKLENGKFTQFKNRISFDNKEIMDCSIFKYKLKNDENDINDFIFLLFKHSNILNNNKFIYSTENSDLFHWFNLDKEINEENNEFIIFKLFNEYPNNHIYISNISLINNKNKLFNISYIKLGEKTTYFEQSNEDLDTSNNLNNINELLKSNNYNDYIIYMTSPNYEENEFKKEIINKYKALYDIDLEEEIFKIKNSFDNNDKDDISKINYFLINIIANQALFKIKNYLLKRNALNTAFIFPIDQICLACKILLKSIKSKISKENKGNSELEKILNIIINILKIIKNRNRTYNEKLFGGEKEIILEQESLINSMLFDAEMTLFIEKIQNLFYENQLNNDENREKQENSFFNIFSLNNGENIINEININQLCSKFNELFNENNIKHIFESKDVSIDSLLYLFKFIIFNYYFYYIYPNISKENENDNLQYFKSIISEFITYYDISKTLYSFDNMNERQENKNISELIKFLKFISDEKLLRNEQLNKIIPLNIVIYKLIKSLYDFKFFNEAFDIGNSLLSSLSTFDEFNIYLLTILELKDYPLAYSFINNCLLLLYKDTLSQDDIKKFLESENYYEIKNLYFNFYEYLIRHKAIDVLFKLPLNFIEIYLFKEICEENEPYKEFLIIYYLIIGNIDEAKYQFQKYLNSNFINESQSKILYANLIKYYETLMNKKNKNEKIDEIIGQLSTENKFLIEIDDENERKIIEQRRNLPKKEEIAFSEFMLKSSLMENKIISGLNYNINDYEKFSVNLLSNFNNKNIGINLLKKKENNFINNNNLNSDKEKNMISINNINSDSD